jgi:S1-C subfamily serine protease
MPNPFASRFRAIAAVLFCLLLGPAARAADDTLDAATLKKAKAAAVRLKVTLPDDSVVQGSGFFGAGPNLVLTNAHVLGMLREESRKPKKVEVIVNGGTDNEKTYTARVLGVDEGSDLGVLHVDEKNLPEPLGLAPGNVEVLETSTVFIFGYPFGEELNKAITVTKSTVSGMRKTHTGYPQIQLAGGLHPGNSGGPILNAKGAVVGVAVSGLKGTQIHFAVPVGYVHGFLSGRTHRWFYGVPYRDGKAIKMPLTTMTYDPLNSVKFIRAEVWTGDSGPTRNGPKSRDPLPGDSDRVKTDLTYKGGSGSGEITLPDLPNGKVFWIQLFNVKQNGESWIGAFTFSPQVPVERAPVVLTYKPQALDLGKMVLSCDAQLKLRDKDGGEHSLSVKYQTDLVREMEGKPKPDGTSTAKVTFSNAKRTVTIDGKEEPGSAKVQQLLAQVEKVPTTLSVTREGDLTLFKPSLTAVPAADRNVMAYLVLQMAQGLDSTVVPLTGKEAAHDKPWTAKREVVVSVLVSTELAFADMNYRYLGVRTVGGRKEAVVKADGTLRGRKGEGLNIAGKMDVQAMIDVESGQVVGATARIDVDLDLTEDGLPSGVASGVYSVNLRRLPKAK